MAFVILLKGTKFKKAMGVEETPNMSMKKKRSLEALEQRFAKINSPNQVTNQSLPAVAPCSPFSSVPVTGPVLRASSKKQSSKDSEDDPTYFKLSKPVHENLLKLEEKLSGVNEAHAVQKIVNSLIENGDKAEHYRRGVLRTKIDHSLLLDNYVQRNGGSMKSRRRLLQKHTKRSKHHMSLKQHRQCGSFDVPKMFHNFDSCKPMNHMWEEYIKELLHEKRKNGIAQHLLTADLHGAILLVAESKIAGFTGEWGIMIRETAQTFGIVTVNNVFRVVPKRGSTFILRADKWKITLIGDKLLSRNGIVV
ncbi:ribonuclease MRP protein subunit POP4 isoform X2 [Nymphaea colorata]|nr:ribonuclease MRP protein subunit POP4 isoform X2 [Nymphaea colorata]